jgi:hypothetical protein
VRFVCGYVHMEWQFDLFLGGESYHYFLCKCGVVKRHTVITLPNDAQAIKWFQDRFDDDCKDIENGII